MRNAVAAGAMLFVAATLDGRPRCSEREEFDTCEDCVEAGCVWTEDDLGDGAFSSACVDHAPQRLIQSLRKRS